MGDQAAKESSAGDGSLARVGLDLHDGPLQDLAFLVGHARALRADLAAGTSRDALAQSAAELEEVLVELEHDLRGLAASLVSGRAPPRPFFESLEETIDQFRRRSGLTAELEVEGDVNALPAACRDPLLQIAREALENVRKHSGATHVTVELRAGPSSFLEVRDDGKGFDPAQTAGSGLGVPGMRERMWACGGTLTVERVASGGTRVRAVLPPS